jgi:hypothetical protein
VLQGVLACPHGRSEGGIKLVPTPPTAWWGVLAARAGKKNSLFNQGLSSALDADERSIPADERYT